MKSLTFCFMFVCAGLAGCGGKSDVAPAQSAAPAPQPTTESGSTIGSTVSPAPKVRPLSLPILDRSTDIRGPDANNNDVRDDIEAWINSQPYTDRQRRLAMQAARALQRTLLVDVTDRAALQRSHEEIAAAAECVNSDSVTENLILRIEAITANTRERAKRYVQYSMASSGSVIKLPDAPAC